MTRSPITMKISKRWISPTTQRRWASKSPPKRALICQTSVDYSPSPRHRSSSLASNISNQAASQQQACSPSRLSSLTRFRNSKWRRRGRNTTLISSRPKSSADKQQSKHSLSPTCLTSCPRHPPRPRRSSSRKWRPQRNRKMSLICCLCDV